jgi:Family of unknown function (DUF5309)
MAVTSALLTYGDTSRVDDVVLNAVEILTAEENRLLTTLGKSMARDTVHSYLVDSLLTPGSLAVQMGADFTASALTTPTRLTNIVEEIAKTFIVSRAQEKVQHYSGQNEQARQQSKALKDWGNAAEFDLVRSTLVSGVSGTVAKMNGVIVAISKSTNTTAHTSGTVVSASILDALMQNAMDNSNGDVPTNLLVGGVMRRAIDGFTQKTNQVVNNPAGPAIIIKNVDTYQTSFGTLAVAYHRYVDIAGTDATGRLLAIRPEKLKIAYLDTPFIKDLAESGAYSKKAVYGSLTLEVNNQDSNFFTSGFLRSA